MTELASHFAVLFGYSRYRDFPVTRTGQLDTANRATCSKHVASAAVDCASSLGLFYRAEEQSLTDAVYLDTDARTLAKLEWEWLDWTARRDGWWHEYEQLLTWASGEEAPPGLDLPFAALIYYSRRDRVANDEDSMREDWTPEIPLVGIAITYHVDSGVRELDRLRIQTYAGQRSRLVADRPALPWEFGNRRF